MLLLISRNQNFEDSSSDLSSFINATQVEALNIGDDTLHKLTLAISSEFSKCTPQPSPVSWPLPLLPYPRRLLVSTAVAAPSVRRRAQLLRSNSKNTLTVLTHLGTITMENRLLATRCRHLKEALPSVRSFKTVAGRLAPASRHWRTAFQTMDVTCAAACHCFILEITMSTTASSRSMRLRMAVETQGVSVK